MAMRPLCLLLAGLFALPVPARAALTEGARLAAIYDLVLQARFDEARRALSAACPPAPVEACRALGTAVTWWQIVLDPESPALDARFESDAKASIAAAEAWTRREPQRAEAWFYLAASYAPLTQWQALRGEHLAAGRNGNRIRVALERTVELDPSLHDAYFGIGMYHYWADVAPFAARVLRVLLLLPGGDREKGLREMSAARNQGVLLAGEADFQLHWLYLWFEHDPTTALGLVRSLDQRYPSNPVFLQRVAEIEHDYRHDHLASAAAWEAVLARAQKGAFALSQLAETRARLGLAHEWLELSRASDAIAALQPVIEMQPIAPYAAVSVAQFHLGAAYEAIGQRDRATAAYNAAIAAAPRDDPARVRTRSRDALRKMSRR